jgi:hypothetical protein
MNSKKNAARREMQQQRVDAGFVAAHFPDVAGIVINMMYNQKGTRSLSRTVNFFPGSYALFRIACLNNDCVDGGFDLSQVINSMIRNHRETAKGDLNCESADHSAISYEVAIQYA